MAYQGLLFMHNVSSILLKKFTFWRLAWCPVMLATYKENCQPFLFSKQQLVNYLHSVYLRLCHTMLQCAMVIIRRDAVLGSSVWFFSMIQLSNYVIKPTIVLIIHHFSTSAKFHKIPWQYQNFTENGKFRSSARNSAARGKLWALVTT